MFQNWKDVEAKQVLQILKDIKSLFEDKSKWITWPLAETSFGTEANPQSEVAVKWSLMGAIEKFAFIKFEAPLHHFVDNATRDYLNNLAGDKLWKTSTSYEDEVALIALAIEDLEKK